MPTYDFTYKKDDMVIPENETVIRCRICRMILCPKLATDIKLHKEYHQELADGGLSYDLRELMKTIGWAVLHNSKKNLHLLFNESKDSSEVEIGKLSIAYAWWARARTGRDPVPKKDFDDYMTDHLRVVDFSVSKIKTKAEKAMAEKADAAIKRWTKYGG